MTALMITDPVGLFICVALAALVCALAAWPRKKLGADTAHVLTRDQMAARHDSGDTEERS